MVEPVTQQIDTMAEPQFGGIPQNRINTKPKSNESQPESLQDGIDVLVPLIIKLQNAFSMIKARNDIELPQLVVVGAQSAGKSSVLESIVGRDFLPRGKGIVTRCPLILNLKRIGDEIEKEEVKHPANEYAVFSHKEDQIFTNFDLVR